MQTFKVTYENGFEVIHAWDIFHAVAYLKREYKRTFRMPQMIQLVTE